MAEPDRPKQPSKINAKQPSRPNSLTASGRKPDQVEEVDPWQEHRRKSALVASAWMRDRRPKRLHG